ncbi:hypothetical protein BDR26DRAFT_624243 [Obelidium mucronatum]|nr:hypothetical protein BDR26DRAFT_624243 [Obelidium mucronatum]
MRFSGPLFVVAASTFASLCIATSSTTTSSTTTRRPFAPLNGNNNPLISEATPTPTTASKESPKPIAAAAAGELKPLQQKEPTNNTNTGIVKQDTPDGHTVSTNFNPSPQQLAQDEWDCEDVADDEDAVCFDVSPNEKLQDLECVEVFDDFVDFACEIDRVDNWECDSDPWPIVSPFSFGGALGSNGIAPMMPGGIMMSPPASGTMGSNGTIGAAGGAGGNGGSASGGSGIKTPSGENGDTTASQGNPNLGTNGSLPSAGVSGLPGLKPNGGATFKTVTLLAFTAIVSALLL